MMMFTTALVIGRFQPFHLGHLHLLQVAFATADKVTIAIGSSNVSNEQNPYSYEVRKQMVERVILNEGWHDRLVSIVPSPDFPSDEEWLTTLLQNAGSFDVALGNNDWTNGVMEAAGLKVIRVPHWQRELYEGTKVRQLMKDRGDWQQRVPEVVASLLDST